MYSGTFHPASSFIDMLCGIIQRTLRLGVTLTSKPESRSRYRIISKRTHRTCMRIFGDSIRYRIYCGGWNSGKSDALKRSF